MSPTKAQLQEQLSGVQEELEQARQRLAALEKQVQGLAQANQRQSSRIQELETENQALKAHQQPGLLMGAAQETAEAEDELQQHNQQLQDQVQRLQAQLQGQDQTPVLGAEQVGELVRELYQQLSGSFPGLSVRGGQVTMKFRAQPLAGKGGFLLAGAAEQAPDPNEVQEITLQFDRRGLSEP